MSPTASDARPAQTTRPAAVSKECSWGQCSGTTDDQPCVETSPCPIGIGGPQEAPPTAARALAVPALSRLVAPNVACAECEEDTTSLGIVCGWCAPKPGRARPTWPNAGQTVCAPGEHVVEETENSATVDRTHMVTKNLAHTCRQESDRV